MKKSVNKGFMFVLLLLKGAKLCKYMQKYL